MKYINWIVSIWKCTIRATNHLSWHSCTYFHHLPVAYTLGQVCTSLSHYSSFYFQVVKLFDLPFLKHLMLWVLELFEMHSFHLCSFTCFCTRSSVHTWHQLKIIFKDLTQVYSVWLFFGVWFLCCHYWPVLSEMNGCFIMVFLLNGIRSGNVGSGKCGCGLWEACKCQLKLYSAISPKVWLPQALDPALSNVLGPSCAGFTAETSLSPTKTSRNQVKPTGREHWLPQRLVGIN